MSGTFRDIFSLSVKATAAITANRFMTHTTGAVPAANASACGVARTNAAIGDYVSCVLLGTAQVEAGAAIAKDAQIGTDASGRAITWVSGGVLGYAREAASGAGIPIEVMLLPN